MEWPQDLKRLSRKVQGVDEPGLVEFHYPDGYMTTDDFTLYSFVPRHKGDHLVHAGGDSTLDCGGVTSARYRATTRRVPARDEPRRRRDPLGLLRLPPARGPE